MKATVRICTYFVLLAFTAIFVEAQNGRFTLESARIKCDDISDKEETSDPIAAEITTRTSMLVNDSVENDIDMEILNARPCKLQIALTLKVVTYSKQFDKSKSNSEFRTNKSDGGDEGALIQIGAMIDENNRTVYLGQPIVVKIQQLPVLQLYSIKYISTINAKASEDVYNYENTPDYKGCKETGSPVCRVQTEESENSETIAITRGFCCPCSPEDFDSQGRQIRGGQLCQKSKSESNTNMTSSDGPSTFSSVHCFKLSKFWYAVHELGPPQIFQEIFVQIFKRVESENGSTAWDRIGESAHSIRVDSHLQSKYEDEELSVSYRPSSSASLVDRLYMENRFLLIPKISPGIESDEQAPKLPTAMIGNLDETYLVVSGDIVDSSGRYCDTAGVGYTAFMTQSAEICHKPRGSCLLNQPLDLWASDTIQKRFQRSAGWGKKAFKLKHFGNLHLPTPIKSINERLFLALDLEKQTSAYVDIIFPADDMFLLKPGYGAAVLYVISDSSISDGKLTIQVANKEFIPSSFGVQILHCTESVFPTTKPGIKLISPQDVSTFAVIVKVHANAPLSRKATCTVAVINQQRKIIAIRDALLSPGDTCICKLQCQCVCAKDTRTTCVPMKVEKIQAAGLDRNWFQESHEENEPISSGYMSYENGRRRSVQFYILLVILVVFILLFLGLLKAMLGKCWKRAGLFGLGYFTNKPRRLTRYYESHYSHISVIHDEDGVPLDPFTHLPTVQTLSNNSVFVLNIVFFLLFPYLILAYITTCCCRILPLSRSSSRFSSRGNVSTTETVQGKKSRYKETQSEPLLPSQKSSRRSMTTNTRVASLRPSNSSVEYNYRRGQGGGTEYSIDGGEEWRDNPRALSRSDTSIRTSGMSNHVPTSEQDIP